MVKMVKYVSMHFRMLTVNQLYNILALREQVFALEQKCTEIDLDGLDKDAIHVAGFEDGEIFAVARILPPGVYKKGAVSFGRVAVKNEYRGRGRGKSIMQIILDYIKEQYPNIPIEFSAQAYLLPFYEKLGFKKTGKIYDEGGIKHIKMRSK